MSSISGIYEIVNTVNGKRYIGSSADIKDRWSTHKRLLRNNKHHSPHLQRAWIKQNECDFSFRILELCDVCDLVSREQKYIDLLSPEYNISPTAGSPRGHRHTEEAIKKISEAGKRLWSTNREKMLSINKGRVCPQETRDKISKSMMGKNRVGHKPTATAVERMKKAQAGHPVSKEQREKLRIANLGKKTPDEIKNKISNSMRLFWKKNSTF